jgi:REP element-mobilizing transposase RayT
MSIHAYSRCWIHLVWATLNRERMLEREARRQVSQYLTRYAKSKQIPMLVNYVNADHVHALIDLPTGQTIEEVAQLLKGSSSHWINEQGLVAGKFAWGRGYGAFSVSQSALDSVVKYINGQDEHHRLKTFAEEYEKFVRAYGLSWAPEVANR